MTPGSDRLRAATDTDNPKSLAARARAKRWREFGKRFPDIAELNVLDLGGTPRFWRSAPVRPRHVTIVNLITEPADEPWIDSLEADVCTLDLEQLFDLVVSNSLIEHLGGHQQRREFAEVVKRHADRYWIQTPNKYFPIEPHWLFPLMQFMPRRWRIAVAQHWKLGHIRAATREQAAREVDGVELLGRRSLASHFPQAEIYVERFAGLAKSITAIKQ